MRNANETHIAVQNTVNSIWHYGSYEGKHNNMVYSTNWPREWRKQWGTRAE